MLPVEAVLLPAFSGTPAKCAVGGFGSTAALVDLCRSFRLMLGGADYSAIHQRAARRHMRDISLGHF